MHPQKKYYRQRAHSNPIADHCFQYPVSPCQQDWSQLFPGVSSLSRETIQQKDTTTTGPTADNDQSSNSSPNDVKVHFLDIGCGYGGLLVALSPLFPDKNMLGIEIRVKVCDYVQDRIRALRAAASSPTAAPAAAAASIAPPDSATTSADDCSDNASSPSSSSPFQNIACIRSNAMKYLPNFFPRGSIEKMFFLFPDPHFKKQKHKWRIISQQLLAEYAYVLRIGAKVYIATDVKDLFDWMQGHFAQHPLFREDPDKDQDPVLPLLFESTEEGKKVTRMGGQKFAAVFVRIQDPRNASADGIVKQS